MAEDFVDNDFDEFFGVFLPSGLGMATVEAAATGVGVVPAVEVVL